MLIWRALPSACVLALSLPVASQLVDGLPTEHTTRIAPGGWVDLDTGLVLPKRVFAAAEADLVFDRDGSGFYLDVPGGAVATPESETVAPPLEAFVRERQRLDLRAARSWFVRTDHQSVARVPLHVVDPYSTSSAVLTWVITPPRAAEFWPGPDQLTATWRGDALIVRWKAEEARFLVRFKAGDREGALSVHAPEVEIPDARGAGQCHVEVRGLRARGVVTLPASLVRFGADQPAQRGEVVFQDRWYDATGGLSLRRGEVATDDADVVFYLYGVYAPGGGVQKVGAGDDAFRALAAMPATGYLPSYGRLDAWDVLAVRIADGRLAKLILVPNDGSDLRSGMRVRSVFLPDGRDRCLPAPVDGAFARRAEGVRLTWAPVEGAVRYRIETGGRPARETTAALHVLADLTADRFHRVAVVAIDALGGESDPCHIDAHTFGEGYRVGTFRLPGDGRTGWCLANEEAVAAGEAMLDAVVCNRAGNTSFALDTPHGSAPAGGLAFGEFPAVGDPRPFGTRYDADARERARSVFLLRTSGGALASVRIRVWSHEPEFDYVLRLR